MCCRVFITREMVQRKTKLHSPNNYAVIENADLFRRKKPNDCHIWVVLALCLGSCFSPGTNSLKISLMFLHWSVQLLLKQQQVQTWCSLDETNVWLPSDARFCWVLSENSSELAQSFLCMFEIFLSLHHSADFSSLSFCWAALGVINQSISHHVSYGTMTVSCGC